jgi:hypothetical protein
MPGPPGAAWANFDVPILSVCTVDSTRRALLVVDVAFFAAIENKYAG